VEFIEQMSKTQLWRFKFGIGGLFDNINEGWDESSVVHCTLNEYIKLFTLLIGRCSTDLQVGSSG